MADFTDFAADVVEMLAEDGTACTISRRALGGYDPITDSGTAAGAPLQAQAIKLPVSTGDAFRAGSSVIGCTSKLIIAPLPGGIVPKPGDQVAFAGDPLAAIRLVATMAPDGIPLYHECYLEGGA